MKYPAVLGESETLDRVINGASLSRFGDGEFAAAGGRSIVTQPGDPRLAMRLRDILYGDTGGCLVGIPNLGRKDMPSKKRAFYEKYRPYAQFLNPDVAYVSSLVTRPDCAPWLDTPSYWRRLESLWRGRAVTLVRGAHPLPHPKQPARLTGGVSLVAADLTSASSVTEIIGPPVDAWAAYAEVFDQIGQPERVLICLGVAATVMAVDLCRRGVQAIDLGHVGFFLHRHQIGVPMDAKAKHHELKAAFGPVDGTAAAE